MTTKAEQAQYRAEAIDALRRMFPPGAVVTTVLRHVTRSGMSRSISVLHCGEEGIVDASWLVARAVGMRFDRDRGGVKVGGAGMDMGFHLVYELAATLYPDGFTCTGADGYGANRCPSNDHSNAVRDAEGRVVAGPPKPDGITQHRDGGYALLQRWV